MARLLSCDGSDLSDQCYDKGFSLKEIHFTPLSKQKLPAFELFCVVSVS